MKVVIAGGTGFIGSHLAGALVSRGDDAVVLTRTPSRRPQRLDPRVRLAAWGDGEAGWPGVLEGADAVVNLAGETISQRWTPAARERIVSSRSSALERLGAGLRAASARPRVLVSASAVGYYGAHGDEPLDEEAPPGSDFLALTCVHWEEAARALENAVGRLALVRIGMVLGTDGGALPRMLPPFRAGFGAAVGSGKQFLSFVHVEDLVSLFLFVLDDERARGPLNGTAPEPVSMEAFARALRAALRRPLFVPTFLAELASSVALPAVLGEMATLVLDGQRVLPARAKALGFSWKYPTVEAAFAGLFA